CFHSPNIVMARECGPFSWCAANLARRRHLDGPLLRGMTVCFIASDMSLLSLSGVSKRFDSGTQAIARMDLDVAAGEFVSLVGPSGCGKSTALRIIAGLLTPDGGTVTFAEPRPELGFVFQEPTLMPWASALGNARLPLDLEGVKRSEADDRAARALR